MTKQQAESLTGTTAQVPEELQHFRREIDAIDNQIAALLKKRCNVVQQVGDYKRSQGENGCFMRPGREASQLRRVWKEFSDSPFSPIAATAIWRTIISASIHIEAQPRVCVYANSKEDGLFWQAREYFGGFTEIHRQPSVNRVVGELLGGKAEIGIVPAFFDDEHAVWWQTLAQQEGHELQLFAHVPFIKPAQNNHHLSGFAIAKVCPEPTGEDVTLLAVETNDTSINRLLTAFTTAGLKASRVQFINTPGNASAHHLLQLQGFIAPNDPKLEKALKTIQESVLGWKVIGAYALPIELPKS